MIMVKFMNPVEKKIQYNGTHENWVVCVRKKYMKITNEWQRNLTLFCVLQPFKEKCMFQLKKLKIKIKYTIVVTMLFVEDLTTND